MSQNAHQRSKASIAFAILLIGVGTGWLLTAQNVVPGVNWLWVMLLGLLGILPFVVWGFDKVTFAVGSILLLTSFGSLARQSGYLDVNTEIPGLVIAAGFVLLLARWLPIRYPAWVESIKSNNPA